MKSLYLLLPTLLCVSLLYSQSDTTGRPACSTPAQCSLNLINPLYPDNKIDSAAFSYAKIGSSPNFHDVRYSAETCDTTPASTYCADSTQVLKYHVYYPDTSVFKYSNTCRLPALVLFHGGGFLDCGGTLDGADFVAICRQFAQRGFIVFNVEYRRGVLLAPDSTYSAQQLLGEYRAAQDGRGFMRSLIRQARMNTTIYRIDTANIFVGGASAGSVVALNIAYFSKQTMFNAVYPGISTTAILGGINSTFYYGDTTIKYKIKGVVDMWGGLAVPPAYGNNPEAFLVRTTSCHR